MLQVLVVNARLLQGAWARVLVVLLSAVAGGTLAQQRIDRRDGVGRVAPGPARGPEPAWRSEAPDAERACLSQLEDVMRMAGLVLPASDEPELRAQLFGRTKSSPVLFLTRPEAQPGDPTADRLRQKLTASPGYAAFDEVIGQVRRSPELARAVFLRDGYLYTEDPELAVQYGSLTLSLLFREPELQITRGSLELRARRLDDGEYEYANGDERGRRAKLLLFDRVSVGGAFATAPHHVDLRALAAGLGFDELAIRRATREFLAADADYGGVQVRTLLRLSEGKVSLACEVLGAQRAHVQAHRARAARASELRARLVSVIREQVEEALPFDEPKTEDGQQDGQLRPKWRSAYLGGSASFEFNGDRYAVFDRWGRPRPPQVCIDFVLDTFERAAGTWWQSRTEPRRRVLGRMQFDDAALENRRSVERFVEFARAHVEAFDVHEVAPEERVPLRNRQQFFATLYRTRAAFRRGDIVAILGPRADDKLHYHSFFIVDSDPLSGMPTELAANAGRPRIRSWEGEMQSAPRRSIVARIRPRQVWLESFLAPEGRASGPGPRDLGVSAEDSPPALGPQGKLPVAG